MSQNGPPGRDPTQKESDTEGIRHRHPTGGRPHRMAARPHRTETVEAAENVEMAEDVGAPPTASDEPPAQTRLTVQRGLFFGPSALVPEDLYSVVTRVGARRERRRVVLDAH